jgi:hypothetical protein
MASSLAYFAYGSNLHPLRLLARTPSCVLQCTAHLAAHVLRFHKRGADRSGKADVIPGGQSDRVHGAVYLMSPADKSRLDRIEGLGAGYTHREVTVETPAGPMAAFCYQAMDTHIQPGLAPFAWYRELVLAGARHHRLPRDYVQAIERVPCVPDPDRGRAARHLDVIDQTA